MTRHKNRRHHVFVYLFYYWIISFSLCQFMICEVQLGSFISDGGIRTILTWKNTNTCMPGRSHVFFIKRTNLLVFCYCSFIDCLEPSQRITLSQRWPLSPSPSHPHTPVRGKSPYLLLAMHLHSTVYSGTGLFSLCIAIKCIVCGSGVAGRTELFRLSQQEATINNI